MRCSFCRPLLEGYLAETLRPRLAYTVRTHLSTCHECTALFEQTKVVDALLSTSSTLELSPNFTRAAMDQVRAMAPPRHKHPALWAFLIVYVASVWSACFIWLALTGRNVLHLTGTIERATSSFIVAFGSLAGGGHTLGRGAGLILAFGLGVLLLDFALFIALLVVYRIFRPQLAARISTIPEAS